MLTVVVKDGTLSWTDFVLSWLSSDFPYSQQVIYTHFPFAALQIIAQRHRNKAGFHLFSRYTIYGIIPRPNLDGMVGSGTRRRGPWCIAIRNLLNALANAPSLEYTRYNHPAYPAVSLAPLDCPQLAAVNQRLLANAALHQHRLPDPQLPCLFIHIGFRSDYASPDRSALLRPHLVHFLTSTASSALEHAFL